MARPAVLGDPLVVVDVDRAPPCARRLCQGLVGEQAGLDALGELDLLLGVQQGDLADLLEVVLDRVGGGAGGHDLLLGLVGVVGVGDDEALVLGELLLLLGHLGLVEAALVHLVERALLATDGEHHVVALALELHLLTAPVDRARPRRSASPPARTSSSVVVEVVFVVASSRRRRRTTGAADGRLSRRRTPWRRRGRAWRARSAAAPSARASSAAAPRPSARRGLGRARGRPAVGWFGRRRSHWEWSVESRREPLIGPDGITGFGRAPPGLVNGWRAPAILARFPAHPNVPKWPHRRRRPGGPPCMSAAPSRPRRAPATCSPARAPRRRRRRPVPLDGRQGRPRADRLPRGRERLHRQAP